MPGRADPDAPAGRHVLGRVLEQVGDHLVEEDRVDEAGEPGPSRSSSTVRSGQPIGEPIDDRPDHVVEVGRLEVGPQRARLDPAEVEQVRHEPVEVLGLPVDRQRAGAAVLVGHRRGARSSDRPGGGADRGQRRPQIVRDRLEQGRLEGVALAGDLGRLRLVGEAILLECLADLVGGGGEQPGLGAARARRRSRARTPQTEPIVRPAASITTRWARTPAPPLRWTPGWWTLTHCAGVSPGVRRSTAWLAVGGGRADRPSVSATIRSGPASRIEPDPDALEAGLGLEDRAISASTAIVADRVASARLTRNWAIASRSRSTAASARARWVAASWPTTIPPTSRRTRLSHSPGSVTTNVWTGSTNRKSYSRNPPNAARMPAPVPNAIAQTSTARR